MSAPDDTVVPPETTKTLYLDGNSLTVADLMSVNVHSHVDLTPEAWESVRASRAVVDKILESKQIVYGINTGFGNFSEVIIPEDKLTLLQENLIRSHASGVGAGLTPGRTKRLLALRINVLAKGESTPNRQN